jgi:hypothetical protein
MSESTSPERPAAPPGPAPRSGARARLCRLAPRVLVTGVSLALALGAAEVVVRRSPAMDRLGWNRVPSVLERLAAVRPRVQDEPGELRVLGLGDSFADFRDTDGANFLRVLEREAIAAGRPVVLDNLGEAGTGLVRYLENLERYSERAVPDIAIVAVYLGNDLLDYDLERRRVERGLDGARSGSGAGPAQGGWRDLLRRRSVLANALFRAAKASVPALRSGTYRRNLATAARLFDLDDEALRAAEARVAPEMIERAEADAINAWDLAFGVVRPELYTEMLTLDGSFASAFDGFAADLVRIGEACEERGITPVFVSIPPSLQVSTRYHDYFRRLGHVLEPDRAGLVGETTLSQRVAALLAARDWPVLDLTRALAASDVPLYIPDDIHWNTLGQDVAGRALHRFLEAHGWFEGAGERAAALLERPGRPGLAARPVPTADRLGS